MEIQLEILIAFFLGTLVTLTLTFIFIKLSARSQEQNFKILASEILKNQTEDFKSQASERMDQSVAPLNERIKEYKELLSSMQRIDLTERESLRVKLGDMIESASRIEEKALNLTNALSSDVKFQGTWGEFTLENILDLAGLEKNREYFLQEVLKDSSGNTYRPDVVVRFPNDTKLIIDSKVSLSAYFDYVNSEDKNNALKNLRISVKNHVDQLSQKKYQNLEGVGGIDFVYMFIPVEGVYSLVLKENPDFLEYAIKKNVILVSPVNLIANLKTVASIWRLEKQSQNAELVATKAGAMYDKFASLVEDLEKLTISIDRSKQLQETVMNKLATGRGNLLNRSEELKELGAKTSKSLPADL